MKPIHDNLNQIKALDLFGRDQKDWLHGLAYVYCQHQHYDQAKDLWLALLEFSPYDQKILMSLAFCCLKQGDFEQCLVFVERFQLTGPNGKAASIDVIKGKALWGLQKQNEAQEMGQRYLDSLKHHSKRISS